MTIKAMLVRNHIAFGEEVRGPHRDEPEKTVRIFYVGDHESVSRGDILTEGHVGYNGFYSALYFDNNGNLLNIGSWE